MNASEYYTILLSLCIDREINIKTAYKQIRDLLQQICMQEIGEDKGLQTTDLSAKIAYVATALNMKRRDINRLHSLRITANEVLNRKREADKDTLLRDIKTLASFVKLIYKESIPRALSDLLPTHDNTYICSPYKAEKKVKKMRATFLYLDDDYLYVSPRDSISPEPLKVRYGIEDVNKEFDETIKLLWQNAQINLLDIDIDKDGILTPRFIILEPDFLIDISTLAECFKEYGHHPANYFFMRLSKRENTLPMLLGNIANLFLDEWINGKTAPEYLTCMKKAFTTYPLELASNTELNADTEMEYQFFNDCKKHFDNINNVVNNLFPMEGFNLDKEDAVLEPSYICEPLGLQGRLDYMQRDHSAFIEMKSGKGDEYSYNGHIGPKENNHVQMLLYLAVLEYSVGRSHKNIRPFLLYTRYPLLYPSKSNWTLLRRVMNVRNTIIYREYEVQRHNDTEYTAKLLSEIDPTIMNERQLEGKLWNVYLCPAIVRFQEKLSELTELERDYFLTIYNFITKELYTSKSGDIDNEGCCGASSVWNASIDDKEESGEIIYNLKIKENHASDAHKAFVIFQRKKTEKDFPSNFRNGDAIVLYERNRQDENVTTGIVFKGNIEYITDEEIKVRLRATQRNKYIMPSSSYYALEHDYMDTSFRTMYQGLVAYLNANKRRRNLIMGVCEPEFSIPSPLAINDEIIKNDEYFKRIITKADAADDFFLLVGPPGTGKTSMAIKGMVENFYNKQKTILLLSYTNRAVDELCKSLKSMSPSVNFIRIGSEINCGEEYREYLIENIIKDCTKRSEVQTKIEECRIFLGTVSTLSSKTELFLLKDFDVAIIDEATQILEPQLLGLLCMKNRKGKDSIKKFIMVGDHKQLPAVVLQPSVLSEVKNESLRNMGLTNIKDSLFERMFRKYAQDDIRNIPAIDMLTRHGRMHPQVAEFVNREFYNNLLEPVGLKHQREELPSLKGKKWEEHPLRDILSSRIKFIPSQPEPKNAPTLKQNHSEAKKAAELSKAIYEMYEEQGGFDNNKTLGIIAPYRSQIALIRKELEKTGIIALTDICIDTVERFQGGERDVIIYSFCLNSKRQIKFLSNKAIAEGQIVDRKLNVALTRARKQLFILGVPEIMKEDHIFGKLLHIKE